MGLLFPFKLFASISQLFIRFEYLRWTCYSIPIYYHHPAISVCNRQSIASPSLGVEFVCLFNRVNLNMVYLLVLFVSIVCVFLSIVMRVMFQCSYFLYHQRIRLFCKNVAVLFLFVSIPILNQKIVVSGASKLSRTCSFAC